MHWAEELNVRPQHGVATKHRRITSLHAAVRPSAQARAVARRYFIYLSWLPTYFLEVHGLNLRNSSALAFIPWLVMAIGSSVSGILADRWLASGASVATVRKTFQSIAFAVSLTPAFSNLAPRSCLCTCAVP